MSQLRLTALGLIVAGAFAAPLPSATAAPLSPARPAIEAGSGVLEAIQYRPRSCRFWRHECANRWGWGGWRFRRCLRIRGC